MTPGNRARICPSCRRRVVGSCSQCQAQRQPKPRRNRVGYGRREADRRADTVRAWVERNGWVCPGWRRDSHESQELTADHVDPLALGGPQSGELAVLCKTCNSAKQEQLPPPVHTGFTLTVVAGAPCAGKNSYVREHAGPLDLIVDYDALATALQVAGLSHGHVDAHKVFVWEARDAVLERLRLGGHGVRHAWVIASAPKRKDRERLRHRYGAEVVVVMSPEEVCLRRAMNERPADWCGYVRSWFRDYEPDPRDEVVHGYVTAGV